LPNPTTKTVIAATARLAKGLMITVPSLAASVRGVRDTTKGVAVVGTALALSSSPFSMRCGRALLPEVEAAREIFDGASDG
jgi:hypothetical protein